MAKKTKKIRVCHLGHKVKKETDKDLKKEYPYNCPTCYENELYKILGE